MIKNEEDQISFKKKLKELVKKEARDGEIYSEMHQLVHQQILKDTKENKERSNERVDSVINLLKENNLKVGNFLDCGCGEGSITEQLAQQLSIPKENAHACDIYQVKTHPSFLFQMIQEDGTLPYKEDQFDLVVCFMSIHHFRYLDKMFSEFIRILKNDGVLIIREHDLCPLQFSLFLDVVSFYLQIFFFIT